MPLITRQPKFLNSELVLGQLKSPGEIAALIRYWDTEWSNLRAALAGTQGAERQALLRSADMAATIAFRLEDVLKDRKRHNPNRLRGLLKTAIRERFADGEVALLPAAAQAMRLLAAELQSGATRQMLAAELEVSPSYFSSVVNFKLPFSDKFAQKVIDTYGAE